MFAGAHYSKLANEFTKKTSKQMLIYLFGIALSEGSLITINWLAVNIALTVNV